MQTNSPQITNSADKQVVSLWWFALNWHGQQNKVIILLSMNNSLIANANKQTKSSRQVTLHIRDAHFG